MRKGLSTVIGAAFAISFAVAGEPSKTLAGPLPDMYLFPVGSVPSVTGLSAIVMDAHSGKVLWSKDADTPRYPASTTKIMTALLLIENTNPTDVIVAPADVEKVNEASLHLKPGEKVSAKDMLYALILRSANDGAYTVARQIGGTQEGFAKLMNARAKELGCTNTTFVNPHGLRDDKHMTCARDLALIAREAMTHPEFEQAARTYKYTISRSINKGDTLLVSKNKWLTKDKTADGIKTGYTNPAGKCYVGSATRDGYRIITVVLKSDDWQADHEQMLKWAFGTHDRIQIGCAGEALGMAQVAGGESDQVPAILDKDVCTVIPKGQPAGIRVHIDLHRASAPIRRGDEVGSVTYIDGNGFTQVLPLVAGEDVDAMSLFDRAASSPTLLILGAVGGGLLWKRRARIRRRRTTYERLTGRA